MLPTIFVSIASYRDPDCQNTVVDLFEKAAHPERIFVGICWQFVPGDDDDCFTIPAPRPQQVRTVEHHASASRGACWARSEVQQLYRNEDYYLQVDSHMRFVPGWDEKLIEMLAQCPSDKPVLSTYPLKFTPPDDFEPDGYVVIHPKGFNDHDVLGQRSTLDRIEAAPEVPAATFLIGAGLVFAAGSVVQEVPYDPYLYFEGEEISLAVRLWTHGWDIYIPNAVIAYHDYAVRPNRPRHWDDNADWVVWERRTTRRLRHLLGVSQQADAEALAEIDKYGLGKARTLAEYRAYSGLDFRSHLYRGKPLPQPQLAADQPEQAERRREIFAGIWRDNSWGCPQTRSGWGSTLEQTTLLRKQLAAALELLGVRILADAGCGDLNWMKELLPGLRLYFGFDIVPELVAELQQRFDTASNCLFAAADIVTKTLPECDAIICRDCLTHLPLDGAMMALKRFVRSGSRVLIATTYDSGRNIRVRNGGWYEMDLRAAPFNFPAPQIAIPEGGNKMLGIWTMEGLPAWTREE